MNQEAYRNYEIAETARSQTISKIKALYFDQPEFLIALKESEAAWEKFRESFLEMLFPGEDKRHLYGSVYPMVYNHHKATLTEQHIKELQIWLTGKEEGELGFGSVMLDWSIKERKANQKLDPTVKTPVESGKVQGTAGQL